MFAFILTLLAGLSTGIGSCIAFFVKRTNTKFLCVSLGFSAGVMLYVSMIEIFQKAKDTLVLELGEKMGTGGTVIAFFGGIFLIAFIDYFIPLAENPHEPRSMFADSECRMKNLMRLGIFSALAIAIHNFPEGMATFVSAMQSPEIAVPIVTAIAIHNIPEGIAVSVPIYQATGDKRKAFFYSFFSGLAEPIGGLVGWLILQPIMSPVIFGGIFAAVAGIMVFISLDELLPAAREYGEHHLPVYGMIAGMMVMAVSLLIYT